MSLQARCPQCQAMCRIAESAAGRKIRCPRCQNVFRPDASSTGEESLLAAEPATAAPPPPRGNDLIPPPRKRPSNELIPLSPDGPSVKKTSSFVEREARGLVIFLLVAGVGFVLVLGLIGGIMALAGWGLFKASPQGLQSIATKSAKDQSSNVPARDHGPPPPFEEWTVLAEHRLEQKGGIWHGAASPDGKLLATTSDAFLRLWDLTAEPPVEKTSMRMPAGRSSALHFSPDGKTLFLGCMGDHSLRLLDVAGRRITERLKMQDWTRWAWSVAHSPDGRTLAVGADDMTVWLYDLAGDRPKEKKVIRVENTGLGVKQLFFTPDGRRLILGTGAGAVRLWDVAGSEPRELAARDGESDTFLLPMTLSPDGSILAVARGKTVHLLDVTGDGFAEWMKLDKHPKALRAVNFSPDGTLLATTGTDGQILLWKTGLDRPVLVKQRAGTFGEVLFIPGSKEPRVAACMWSAPGTVYLFKVGK
jgi:predicted Zn finger-like uncharacterized protein